VRANQAYSVNGQRPESNSYLLDGVNNIDNVNGAFAIRVPVDALGEFRILTLNAPAEYGGTSGATTSAVTKSGGNDFHGNVYEFLRNNDLDTRNFFASEVEPLHRNQFGATLGGRSGAIETSSSPTMKVFASVRAKRRPPSYPRPPSARATFRGWERH